MCCQKCASESITKLVQKIGITKKAVNITRLNLTIAREKVFFGFSGRIRIRASSLILEPDPAMLVYTV